MNEFVDMHVHSKFSIDGMSTMESIELLPFRNPMKLETDSFGGISTSMWRWSGHTSASAIFTPFHSHSSLRIFPIMHQRLLP